MRPNYPPVESFLTAISTLVPLDEPVREHLRSQVHVQTFYPKEKLLPDDRLLYVHQGLIRRWYSDTRHRNFTTWLAWEGHFVPQPIFSIGQDFSGEITEFLEETTVVWLSRAQLDHLYMVYPSAQRLEAQVERQIRQRHDTWLRALRELGNKELHPWFLRTYPALTGRMSNRLLASFLGLAPESLSRIRRRK